MNKPFIIVFDNPNDRKDSDLFIESVRSTFVSKIGKQNAIIFSAPENLPAKELYNIIKTKTNASISFIVIPFENFYGLLDDDVWTWLKETFPSRTYTYTTIKDK